MDDVEQVNEETQFTHSEQTEIATQESTEPAKETQIKDEQADANARNWKRANEARKRLEQENRKKDEQIDQLLKALQKPQQPEVADELDALQHDEFIPKGKIDKLLAKNATKIREQTRQEIEEAFNKKEQGRWRERLNQKFSDFEDVVNVETLSLLEEQEPDVAEAIAELKDPYKVGIQTYKYIKALGIKDTLGNSKRKKEVEKKMTENEKTLQSPQVYDKRPLAQAYKVTDAEYKNLYKEMMDAAGQSGFSF